MVVNSKKITRAILIVNESVTRRYKHMGHAGFEPTNVFNNKGNKKEKTTRKILLNLYIFIVLHNLPFKRVFHFLLKHVLVVFFFFFTRQTEILLTWIHPTQDVLERLRKYTISKGKCIVTTTKVHRLKWNQRQIDHENIIMLFSFVHLWLRLFELFYCLFRLVEQRLFHLVSIIRRIQFLGSLKHTSLYIVLNSD